MRSVRWNPKAEQWDLDLESISSGGGFGFPADVVISAVGLFGEPKLPDIAGLDRFAGRVMHTSRWDSRVPLAGRRVAVIGTGASAVQVVPELAEAAAHVTVFQRTPPWMVPKDDRPFTSEELARFRRSPWAARRERWRLWKEQHDNTALRLDDPLVAGRQGIAEEYLRRHVSDALRAALTPDYPFRCKRVLLGGDYYAALQRDNVTLVTDPIREVTETAVRTDAGAVDVDVVVLASGFQTNHYLSGIDVIGVGGQSLHARWGEDPSAYLGAAVAGFPNFFMLYGPNTNQGGNSIVYILEAGARLAADAVARIARRGGYLDVRPEASGGSTTRSGLNSSARCGPSAAATFAHRAGGSSPNGRTRNLSTPAAPGGCERGTGRTMATSPTARSRSLVGRQAVQFLREQSQGSAEHVVVVLPEQGSRTVHEVAGDRWAGIGQRPAQRMVGGLEEPACPQGGVVDHVGRLHHRSGGTPASRRVSTAACRGWRANQSARCASIRSPDSVVYSTSLAQVGCPRTCLTACQSLSCRMLTAIHCSAPAQA